MGIESDLYSSLTNYAALTALIGTRLYPIAIPQEATLPAISYFMVDMPADYTHAARITERPRIQFDCWASTFDSAIAVAEALKDALEAVSGKSIHVSNQYDLPEPETGRFRRVVDAVALHLNP